MAELKFEGQSRAEFAKHGVSFLTAAAIFANEIVERIADREDYGEVNSSLLAALTWRFMG